MTNAKNFYQISIEFWTQQHEIQSISGEKKKLRHEIVTIFPKEIEQFHKT